MNPSPYEVTKQDNLGKELSKFFITDIQNDTFYKFKEIEFLNGDTITTIGEVFKYNYDYFNELIFNQLFFYDTNDILLIQEDGKIPNKNYLKI